MATLSEVRSRNYNYKCDECRKTFSAQEVKLVEPAGNIEIFGASMMMVDKDDKIVSGKPDASKGDRLLACPHCDQVHIFGFDLAKETA